MFRVRVKVRISVKIELGLGLITVSFETHGAVCADLPLVLQQNRRFIHSNFQALIYR